MLEDNSQASHFVKSLHTHEIKHYPTVMRNSSECPVPIRNCGGKFGFFFSPSALQHEPRGGSLPEVFFLFWLLAFLLLNSNLCSKPALGSAGVGIT